MVNTSILIDSHNRVIVEVQGLLLRRIVAGFSPSRPGFSPNPVFVGFVVDRVTLR